MYAEFFLILESCGEIPEFIIAAYSSLVYHIPVGTAHSSDTNFPTIFSNVEYEIQVLGRIDCKINKYLCTLFSGMKYLCLAVSQLIPRYVIIFCGTRMHLSLPKKYPAINITYVTTTIDLQLD